MDDINEKVANLKDMMDLLTEAPDDPDVDDLMKELDQDMERDKKEAAAGTKLPSAPTTIPQTASPLPNVPVKTAAKETSTEDQDLESMLENLLSVCYNKERKR